MNDHFVSVREEKVVIPTYGTGKPDKNPMFFEKRVYQGSSGVVYPHPVIEKILDEKTDVEYTALMLENRYIRIMILPALGGRVQMAYDKIAERHFIYYNQVIKPALVGLCGPWISGGIEFNWPQHHRPSTFDPVDHTIMHNDDGSKTVWVNEVERMTGTKAMTAFTLYPDKAYLEIKTKLYNRTPLPQTFLWWANPAVKVNDHYQSVFPPDVNAVFDHGKRDVSAFPMATGTYYKVDYSPGTDISWYKNIPVPTSYMAIRSDYDFVGGYENDSRAGVLHVANHHVSPGKKQWTWGHSDFGKAWDRNLTDEDGPYIELMTGVFTDNQPDFSWLMPFEEKSFTQYFLPYRELGVVKNASKDLLFNCTVDGTRAEIKVFATSHHRGIRLDIRAAGEPVFADTADISPEVIYIREVHLPHNVREQDLLFIIKSSSGKDLLRYQAPANQMDQLPEPAKAAASPSETENNEQLFLTGQHLEQYRHATYCASDYYREALRRDPRDVRSNNALGKWYLRRGKFQTSEPFFRNAIQTLTGRNPNPYDGEPYYNLGLSLRLQGRDDEAYQAFYKASWNSAWQESAFFSLAQIDVQRADYGQALEHLQLSLDRNAGNSKARALKVAVLRKLDRAGEGLAEAAEALKRDLFNLSAYFEEVMIFTLAGDNQKASVSEDRLLRLSRAYWHNLLEYALDYAAAGLYSEAIELIRYAVPANGKDADPMVFYYLGWFQLKCGDHDLAQRFFKKGSLANSGHCFPNRLQDIPVLQAAAALDPEDARAPYFLGNLWYDKRQYEDAIAMWELSLSRDDRFPTVNRNLGIAYFNKRKDPDKALAFFEKAFACDRTDARILMELDQLYKRLNREPQERLAFLEQYPDLVEFRDDLCLERAALYNCLGQHEKAYNLIMSRSYHPWEGGEGKVSGQYVGSLVEMAKDHLISGGFREAVEKLLEARSFPDNLGEGKLFGAQENDIFYWLGVAYESMGRQEEAIGYFTMATTGHSEPSAAMFYNDQQPDKILYQGLAWQKLGKPEKAADIFHGLIRFGEKHENDQVEIDYFAVSLPDLLIFEDDLNVRNRIHCWYMQGLGYLGLEDADKAAGFFKKITEIQSTHSGAGYHLKATAFGLQRSA